MLSSGVGGLSASTVLLNSGASAQSLSDYKALVCLFLYGGNDGYNVLLPADQSLHTQYLSMRPVYNATSRTGVGVPFDQVIPLNGPSGQSLGFHPSLVRIKQRWTQGQVAVIQNVGNLVEPVSRSNLMVRQRPTGLFAHDEQQEISMLARSDSQGAGTEQGWGASVWSALNGKYGLASAGVNFAMVSFGGANRWQTSPLMLYDNLPPNQTLNFAHLDHTSGLLGLGQSSSQPYVRSYSNQLAHFQTQSTALNSMVSNLNSPGYQAFATTAGGQSSSLHNQLLAVVRAIEARQQLQAPGRQIFFVGMGGFDTHVDQYLIHSQLWNQIDSASHAFLTALESLGMASQVTLFTMSEFGRSLRMNASNGTDHAWSSHQWVMGGAVRGGLYGRAADITPTSEDVAPFSTDVVIPSTSINQYAATLAAWMGLNPTDLNAVFPDLRNFAQPNLGFMNS
ncbi:DUF1501 domain-containing protein [Limnohabitans radicicola]|nr:DUF1501 domain-containing protein [Limnohabitans radicicola]